MTNFIQSKLFSGTVETRVASVSGVRLSSAQTMFCRHNCLTPVSILHTYVGNVENLRRLCKQKQVGGEDEVGGHCGGGANKEVQDDD